MSKVTRSAKGAIVDFDLLKIKEQMAATPKAAPVKARENFIDQRFKRRIKKAATPTAVVDPTEVLDEEPVDE
jgi:hypothetical protein